METLERVGTKHETKIYTEESLELAERIAREAHKGQKPRRNGDEFVEHPLAVMRLARDRGYSLVHQIVAVLHDVLEDNPAWTIDRLRDEGFGEDVLTPLRLLTREEDETYDEYIERLVSSEDKVAIEVKALDIEHNLSDNPTEKQTIKYRRALARKAFQSLRQ